MPPPQAKILVVDDCAGSRSASVEFLRRSGYIVHEASDAEEALREARAKPDVIILDMKASCPAYPGLCLRLKRDAETSMIPVLQVNGPDSAEKAAAIEAGVDSWLARPVQSDELLTHIKLLLKLRVTQQNLRLTNERLCSLLSSINDAYFRLDAGHRILMLNTTAAHVIFNREPEELVDSVIWDMTPSQDVAGGFNQMLDAICRREQMRFEAQFESDRWFDVRIYPSSTEVEVFLRDISEQKKAEEQLRQASECAFKAQQAFQTLMDHIPIGISVTSGPNAIAYALSRYTEELLGVSRSACLGKPITERLLLNPFFHANGVTPAAPEELPLVRAARQGELVTEEEWMVKRADGQMVPVLYTAAPVRDADGRLIGSVGGFQDISERRRALAAIQEQTDKLAEYASMVELASILIIDVDGRIVFWNKGAEEMYGYTKAEAIGRNAHELLKTQCVETCAEIKRKMLEFGWWEGELVHTSKDGRQIVLASRWRLHRNAAGELMAVEVNADITKQRKAEQALAAERAYLRKVLDTSNAFILVMDEHQRYMMANEATARFLGSPLEEIIGKTPFDFIRQQPTIDEINALLAEDRRVIQERREVVTESELTHRDGSHHWYNMVKTPIIEPDGSCHQLLIIGNDITGVKLAQKEATAAKDALAEVNANLELQVQERTAKLQEMIAELENFSYSLTHDMRAPLRAMHGFAHLLEKRTQGELPPSVLDYLRLIKSNATRLDNLIRDALNYSKLMRGEMTLEPIDVDELLRGMIESYPTLRPPKAEVHVEGQLPSVIGNASALTQSFSKLLDNAVKYVAPGVQPRVRIHATAHGERVRLWFEDNGVGIPEDSRERIFTLFQRLNVHIPGTGLGLALVRKSVERMGGKVGVESEIGRGSRFWIELAKANAAGLQQAA